jgi:tRNA-splicing ligase RtcB
MDLKKISDVEWEIPAEGEMLVPARVFASEELIGLIKEDRSLEQVKNVAKLPGILKAAYAMPDMHQGYGFPIGGVAAFDVEKGVISPGGVGYDINCSVRLLKTNLKASDLVGKEKEIAHSLFRSVPSGVGRGGELKLSDKELDEVLVGGAQWVIEKGYGFERDWKHIEESGKLGGADPKDVSGRAKGRGRGQLGSLGAGNHFLDVLIVDEVFDKKVAKVFGLEKGAVVILIHCGSRGLGHQVASDYIKEMEKEYGFPEYDRELVNAPIGSELGKRYLSAMACAANFAFANKQLITHWVRENMKHYFPDFEAEVVYDICHNIAKFEKFEGLAARGIPSKLGTSKEVPSSSGKVLVMRKGATRSFGPGREEIPEDYRDVGQPVLIPGSMGTASYVLVGTKEAEVLSWGSTAHGAGRVRSRSEAHRKISFDEAEKNMEAQGIFVEFGGKKGMVEEAPSSYKDIEEVVRVSDEAGIGKKVARLVPKLVVIG